MPFDLTTQEGQRAHYAAIKARISARAKQAVPEVQAIQESPVVEEVAPEPVKITGPRDWIHIATNGPKGNFREIAQEVCDKYQVSLAEIRGPRRSAYLMKPRFEIAYRMRQECPHVSFPQMGRLMNRDHTSIMWSCKRYADMLANGEVTL